jgi:uncharacterized protein YbjT (DUF2867 family)
MGQAVLVMGVRGKTGRQVAAALLRHPGVEVRGVGRTTTGLDFPNVTVSHFDWEDPSSWPEAIAGMNSIYLVKPKTADPSHTVASFLKGAKSLERLVLLSEIDTENRDETTDERRVERVIEASPYAWTILRPNWFMQNFSEPSFYLEAIRNAGELKVPTNGQPTSFIDTRDIADVAAAALLQSGHERRCYTLTGPQALTWQEVAAEIGRAADHQVHYIDPPFDEYLAALAKGGMAEKTIAYYRRIYGAIHNGRTAAVSPEVEHLTGHPPRTFSAFVTENKSLWSKKA